MKLNEIETELRNMKGHVLVAEDFYTYAIESVMSATNAGRRIILEMATRIWLVVIKEGL